MAFRVQFTAMRFYDIVTKRQTQAGSLSYRFSGEKGLEDFVYQTF
jgi:hypothetical protein